MLINVMLGLVLVLCTLLGAFVLKGRLRPAMARHLYMMIVACMATWTAGILMFVNTDSVTVAYAGAAIFYMSALIFSSFLLLFTITYPLKISHRLCRAIWTFVIVATCVVAWVTTIDSSIVSLDGSIDLQRITINYTEYLVFAIYFTLAFLTAVVVSLFRLRLASQLIRSQISYYMSGIVITSLPGFYANLILPYTGDYRFIWIGPIAALFFISLTGYAIVKRSFFDVKIATVRSSVYILSLLTMAGVYFGIAYFASIVFSRETSRLIVNIDVINMVIAIALAFIFQPIKRFFDHVTDSVFFRDRYDTDDFIARLGGVLTSTTDLGELLEQSSREIADTFKAAHVSFVVHRHRHSDIVAGVGKFPELADDDYERLRKLVTDADGTVLVVGELLEQAAPRSVQRRLIAQLQTDGVALILMLGEYVGYLLIGEQKSNGYSKRDVRVLDAISDELLIAIQNARSVQEVSELNRTLQQRVDKATRELRDSNSKLIKLDATKDEFVSMASHQLRTPLTSIKGYLSMVLDGDVGELSAPQKKLLAEAYGSSERMVRLIADFLNVSRLQTGKFVIDVHPTDLARVVSEEIELIQRLAQSHEMTLVYKPPKELPEMLVDVDKLRQVIMNFIDNAIYYSRPQSTIVVKLHRDGDEVVFEVHDQGIGVPQDAQKQLFGKFFRADNARRQRPDGTGVGLFLAKRVVAAQGGEIIFESTEGKGSVFGFRLPIKRK